MNRSSARRPSSSSPSASTPSEWNARRAEVSIASSMNDQFSAVETPGIASDTFPGDHSTLGSVASQCSGLSILVSAILGSARDPADHEVESRFEIALGISRDQLAGEADHI